MCELTTYSAQAIIPHVMCNVKHTHAHARNKSQRPRGLSCSHSDADARNSWIS